MNKTTYNYCLFIVDFLKEKLRHKNVKNATFQKILNMIINTIHAVSHLNLS